MRSPRSALLKSLEEALRKVGAQSVLISDLVAARVGLNSTDLECLDLLLLAGPTTAGKLAAHSGLTTGAMTSVIDRLERAGFVRRRDDPGDRRRVLVEVLPAAVARIHPLYAPLHSRMEELNRQYDDRQLAIVADYLSRAFGAGAEHVAWLQTQPRAGRRPVGPHRRPLRRRHAASAPAAARL